MYSKLKTKIQIFLDFINKKILISSIQGLFYYCKDNNILFSEKIFYFFV